jgi:hypothetical protein
MIAPSRSCLSGAQASVLGANAAAPSLAVLAGCDGQASRTSRSVLASSTTGQRESALTRGLTDVLVGADSGAI